MNPDLINGLFELFGGVFITFSIVRLYRDKHVAGVSWTMVAFWAAWGWWNLYFYPSLGQWWSFWGGIGVVVTNTIYLGQLIYYSRRGKGDVAAIKKTCDNCEYGNDSIYDQSNCDFDRCSSVGRELWKPVKDQP